MSSTFDQHIPREGTGALKYELREKLFGTSNVIPMWVADMDFKVPDFVQKALEERVKHPIYGYTKRPDSFFEAAANWLHRQHQWPVKKEWISFSPGVVPALNFAVELYTRPGDNVIVQPPVYFPFFSAINNNNREILYNPLKLENGRLCMQLEDLKQKIDERTRMIFLSSPHNPGGMVWTKEELTELGKICVDHNIIIFSDEIHADLVYPGHTHIPTASINEDIANLTITFTSPSKTFNLAGLSTAVMIAQNESLRSIFQNYIWQTHLHQGNIFGNIALEAAYNFGDEWKDELIDYLKGNLETLERFLNERIPEITPIRPESTYLVWLDCRKLELNDAALRKFMIHEAGLGLSDGPLFGHGGSGFQRMNIACSRQKLEQALSQLEKAVIATFRK